MKVRRKCDGKLEMRNKEKRIIKNRRIGKEQRSTRNIRIQNRKKRKDGKICMKGGMEGKKTEDKRVNEGREEDRKKRRRNGKEMHEGKDGRRKADDKRIY